MLSESGSGVKPTMQVYDHLASMTSPEFNAKPQRDYKSWSHANTNALSLNP